MPDLTDEQQRRLAEERRRQQEAEERMSGLAKTSLTEWIMAILKPFVGRVVSAVVDFFANLFR